MELDLRGQECPLPTRRAAEELRRAREAGATDSITVLTDDAICGDEFPVYARALGFVAHVERTGPDWRIVLDARAGTSKGT